VITGRDTPGITYDFFKHLDPRFGDKLPLEIEKARFVGDEIAAVAAADEDAAAEALSLIEVDYHELPAVFDPAEALADGARSCTTACRATWRPSSDAVPVTSTRAWRRPTSWWSDSTRRTPWPRAASSPTRPWPATIRWAER
jgi:CO/xanthine dehydrogenase Mo-binding subunit